MLHHKASHLSHANQFFCRIWKIRAGEGGQHLLGGRSYKKRDLDSEVSHHKEKPSSLREQVKLTQRETRYKDEAREPSYHPALGSLCFWGPEAGFLFLQFVVQLFLWLYKMSSETFQLTPLSWTKLAPVGVFANLHSRILIICICLGVQNQTSIRPF